MEFFLELRYSTEFGRESRKFASGVRKYGKFSHFLTHPVVYGGQGKNKYYIQSISFCKNFNVGGQAKFRRKNNNMTRGSQGFVGQSSPNTCRATTCA